MSRVNCVESVQIRSYFWSVFSQIRTEYGDLQTKSLYQLDGKTRTRINSVYRHFSRTCKMQESQDTLILG